MSFVSPRRRRRSEDFGQDQDSSNVSFSSLSSPAPYSKVGSVLPMPIPSLPLSASSSSSSSRLHPLSLARMPERRVDPKALERESKDLKQLAEAATLLGSKLDYDEKRERVLEAQPSHKPGHYSLMEHGRGRFALQHTTPLPQALLDQYSALECKSFVGLLPEISRAYVTLDNKLFLWNYAHSADFYAYSELNQVIVSVGLVRPKPGIFPPEIKYLLVLATPVEVVLLGVRFEQDHVHGALTLYSTQFQCPVDGVHMLKIVGTPNGRIIMCGKDGCVYELVYQAEDGWFSRKCRKLNHSSSVLSGLSSLVPTLLFGSRADPILDVCLDTTRSPMLLFTLSARHAIHVYSLGASGTELVWLAKNDSIRRDALAVLGRPSGSSGPALPDWNDKTFEIVGIASVSAHEAEQVHVVAITEHGHRIFLAYDKRSALSSPALRVRFVRLCPPFVSDADLPSASSASASLPSSASASSASASSSSYLPWSSPFTSPYAPAPAAVSPAYLNPRTRPEEPGFKPGSSPQYIRSAFYKEGVCLLADVRGPSSAGDTLVMMAPENALECTTWHETVESKALQVRVSAIAEIPYEFYLSQVASCLYVRGAVKPIIGLSELATQHALSPRQFLVFTASGLHTFTKSRPVDQLREILARKKKSNDDSEVQHFFLEYGVVEACAMCLIVACSTPSHPVLPSTSASVSASAASPIKYGVESKYHTPTSSRRRPGVVASPASQSDLAKLADAELESVARQAFFQHGAHLADLSASAYEAKATPVNLLSTATMTRSSFSGRLEGLTLYLSRLLRGVWDWSFLVPTGDKTYALRFSKAQLLAQLAPLERLHEFVRQHQRAFAAELVPPLHPEAKMAEMHAFDSLRTLLALSIEALYFLVVLSDQGQLSKVLAMLTEAERSLATKMQFFSLVTSVEGEMLARALISAVMSLRPEDNEWLEVLRQRCSSFFGLADVLHFKASECLHKAKGKWHDVQQRQAYLKQAIKYYKKTALSTSFPIQEVCQNLRSVGEFGGVVELCLYRAALLQRGEIPPPRELASSSPFYSETPLLTAPTQLLPYNPTATSASSSSVSSSSASASALSLQQHTQQQQQQQQQSWFERQRSLCYDAVLETLDVVLFGQYRNPREEEAASNMPLSSEERAMMVEPVIERCLESPDQAFHDQLYSWFISRELKENLFAIRSPFLIRFLTRDEQHVDLLREYYLRNQMFEPAAILLADLSYKKSAAYSARDRLDFLHKALTCAEVVLAEHASSTYRGALDGDAVARLRDRTKICKIQVQIHDQLKAMLKELDLLNDKYAGAPEALQAVLANRPPRSELTNALHEINFQLFDLDKLYAIASAYNLWESCLEIVAFSDHRDQADAVAELWSNVIRTEIRSAAESKADWTLGVGERLRRLADRYRDVPFMFPLERVVRELELHNFRLRPAPQNQDGFVVRVLTETANISPVQLLDAYDRIIESAMSSQSVGEKMLMMSSVYALLEMLHSQHRFSRGRSRLPYANAYNLTSKCLTELQSINTPEAGALYNKFKQLQAV